MTRTWWVYLDKNNLVQLISEDSFPSTILRYTANMRTVWEVQATSAWDALSKVVTAMHTAHPHAIDAPHLLAAVRKEAQ